MGSRQLRYSWANIGLFFLLISQIVTGWWGFMNAESTNKWYLWLHGIGAYTLVLLLLWKAAIILGTIRRTPGMNSNRIIFLLLALLTITTTLTGLIWTFTGPIYLFGTSLITIHILLVAILTPILVYHLIRYRWILSSKGALGRRNFLRVAAVSSAGFIAWFMSGKLTAWLVLPGSKRRFTGSFPISSFTGAFPTVSWFTDQQPVIKLDRWRLNVIGAVNNPASFTLSEILEMEPIDIDVVLDCTGGWFTEQTWRGVRLVDVVERAQPEPNFKSITVRSRTGYQRRFAVEKVKNHILAYEVARWPLSEGHGYPLRLVAPDERGVNWVKWVDTITINETSSHWQSPLPLQ